MPGKGQSSVNYQYTFDDENSFKGKSQYRLQEERVDGRWRDSEIKLVENFRDNILVYPNPSRGKVYIELQDYLERKIIIYDMLGRRVKTIQSSSNYIVIEDLDAGNYTVSITNTANEVLVNVKIVIR